MSVLVTTRVSAVAHRREFRTTFCALILIAGFSDRPLVHVNKKGRPVSQCQHCRGLRKARSQHVKCECHDKAHAKEDCPHEKPGVVKTGTHDATVDTTHILTRH